MIKIDGTELANLVAASVESASDQSNPIEFERTLEDLGVFNQEREFHLKQTLINRTIDFLVTDETVELNDNQLNQIDDELNLNLTINRNLTLADVEQNFFTALNNSLPGGIVIGRPPKR